MHLHSKLKSVKMGKNKLNNYYTNICKKIVCFIEKIRFVRYKKFKNEFSKTIIIFGSPRSGTTWLTNIICSIPHYCTIFEPFHNNWFPESRNVGFCNHKYVSIKKPYKKGKNYIKKILQGHVSSKNPWFKESLLMNPIGFCREGLNTILSEKIIIKCVRANRFIPWMIKNFPKPKYIFILRHPCAVISSQIETNIIGYFPPQKWIIDKELIISQANQILDKDKDKVLLKKIKKIETKEEILSLIWCLDTIIPLKNIDFNKYYLVTYEDLVKDGLASIKKIFHYIDEPMPKKVTRGLNKPSNTTSDKRYLGTKRQLSKWKKKLSADQINSILKVTKWFDLEFYSETEEPDYNLLKNYLKKNNKNFF